MVKFYCDNETCPTCKSHINESFRGLEIDKHSNEITKMDNGVVQLDNQVTVIVSDIFLYESELKVNGNWNMA